MAVSDDGWYLYLLGSQNGEGFIDVVDLAVETIVDTWSYPIQPPQVVGDVVLRFSDMSVLATVEASSEEFIEGVTLGADNNLYVTYRNDGFVPVDPSEEMIDESRFMTIYDQSLNVVANVDFPSEGDGVVPIVNDTAISGDGQRVYRRRYDRRNFGPYCGP